MVVCWRGLVLKGLTGRIQRVDVDGEVNGVFGTDAVADSFDYTVRALFLLVVVLFGGYCCALVEDMGD